MKRTEEQHKRLFGLLKALNLIQMRDVLAAEFSSGRTDSTKELSKEECEDLISHLQWQVNQIKPDQNNASPMAKKFFHLCHKLGMENKDGTLDYNRIRNWCMKYSYLHKAFEDYKEAELPMLLSQLQKIIDKNDTETDKGGNEPDFAPH